MIEQTELVVNKWAYTPPKKNAAASQHFLEFTYLDVKRKTAPSKKGIACRFTCSFSLQDETILEYVAQDTYVIDPDDEISKQELFNMISNAHSKFAQSFDLRKLGTVLQETSLRPLDESVMNLDALLPQLDL